MIDSQPSQDEKTLAVLTHLSGILFSILVPLIVWLTSKETKPWLTEESKEALNFQITVLIAYAIAGALTVIVIGMFLFPLIWLFNIIFCVLGAVTASRGAPYRYPLTLRLIK